MIEFKFSQTYDAKIKRLKRLPRLVELAALSGTKQDAILLIEAFQDGIRNNSFGLIPLQPATIARKARQGLPRPRNPLYGRGDEVDRKSYLNMLRLRKLKNGWKVFPSWGKHHTSELSLRSLLQVHERGTIIKQVRGNKTVLIRIPPRPALRKAHERFLRRRRKRELAQDMKRAISAFIKTGNTAVFNQINKRGQEDRRFDED